MSARAAARPTPGLSLGGEPRANLLPPEVGQRIRARRTRGILVILVAAALLATVCGYAFASLQVMTAQASLSEAQTRTTALLQEKSTYADVISATSTIALIKTTRDQATSTEIIWDDFVTALTNALPQPLLINKFQAAAPVPWVTPAGVSGPLRSPRVATMLIAYWTPTPPDATALYRLMDDVAGVSDMSIDLVEKIEDPIGYRTTITINIDPSALSDRWPDESDDSIESDSTDEEDEK